MVIKRKIPRVSLFFFFSNSSSSLDFIWWSSHLPSFGIYISHWSLTNALHTVSTTTKSPFTWRCIPVIFPGLVLLWASYPSLWCLSVLDRSPGVQWLCFIPVWPPASLLLGQENGLQSLPSRTAPQICTLSTSFLIHSWLPWCLILQYSNIISWKNATKGIWCLCHLGGGGAGRRPGSPGMTPGRTERPRLGSCRLWGCTSFLWPRDQEAGPKKGPLLLLTPNNWLSLHIQEASKWMLECWCRKLQVWQGVGAASTKNSLKGQKAGLGLTLLLQISYSLRTVWKFKYLVI